MLVPMRVTLNIDDQLLARAAELSGLRANAELVRAGLQALVERESARRLAALAGTAPRLRAVRRRRSRARA